jgi:hypothetical protein
LFLPRLIFQNFGCRKHLINVFAQRLTLVMEIKNDKIPYQPFSDEEGKKFLQQLALALSPILPLP